MRARLRYLALAAALAFCAGARAESITPASDADLFSIRDAALRISEASAPCEGAACIATDCAATNAAQGQLAVLETELARLDEWNTRARKDALEHYTTLMNEIIRKGNRQADLEKWLAWQSFFQDFGKLMLNVADGLDFFKNFQKNLADAEAVWFDPSQSKLWQRAALADWVDGFADGLENIADTADILVRQYNDKGLGVPDWLQTLATLDQAQTDAKDAIKGMYEAVASAKEADALRRAADAIGDATQKARQIAEAEQKLAQAREAMSNMRAAIGQLVGKALLAVSEAAQKEMKEEIAEHEKLIDAETAAAHHAWLEWQRHSQRTDAIAAALDAVKAAAVASAPCSKSCPAASIASAPEPPSFKGPDGAEHWGDALRYFNPRIAALRDGIAASSARFSAEAADPTDPRTPEACRAPAPAAEPAPASDGAPSPSVEAVPQPAPAAPETPAVPAPQPAEDTVRDCGAINCDCDNLDFGILTGPYRDECRAAEAALKQLCAERGYLTKNDVCHPTASGPNPWPQ